ncbi:MAG: HDIG domain-containing protein [Deltaproteobacteria bacterium]|nr:HDIG domain-containing protein [Deltaproteobacteria bacterium]
MPEKTRTTSSKRGKSPKRSERDPALRGRSFRPWAGWVKTERLRWVLLPVLSILVAVLLFPNILTKPAVYRLGDIAEWDIKASHDFLVENEDLTEADREKASRDVLAVYDFDGSALNLASRIREAFNAGRVHFSEVFDLDPEKASPSPEAKGGQDNPEEREEAISRFFAVLEINPNERLFTTLVKHHFPARVEEAVIQLMSRVFEMGVVGNRQMLKEQIEKGGIILHEISSKKEIKVHDFDRFYDLPSAKLFIGKQRNDLRKFIGSPELGDAAVNLAQSLIKPNLTFNQRETEQRKELARKSIKPIYFKVKKGEMLVREGERIGPDHLLKLSGETREQSQTDIVSRVPAMVVLIGFFFAVLYMVGPTPSRRSISERRQLVFDAVALLAIFVFFWAYDFVAEEIARGFPCITTRALLFAMPVAFGGMLISVFQGMNMAVIFSMVLSVLASLITGGQVEFFLYFFISSLVAANGVRNCTERGILIKTGLIVGLLNILLSLAIEIIFGSLDTMEVLVAAVSGFLGGILSGVIATGILPLIEMSFGFTTDIKLLELANLDQPLLRDLMVQTPGTYHHSVIISNMVEASAKAVQANPLIARVSAYYHDIGKMKKPLYFIENQIGSENRHEKLAPSMSSLILISHVKDGVELAREHKLGREIIDIIQQHHGTSLITYFYQKAKDRMAVKGSKSTEIKEEDFRYPGPKPQTKEAGLVMLADMVEAASRSLIDPTPARIQGTVQKIVNKAFTDGQLDECELSLKDLHEIAKSFNKTLSGIFHHRIEYPEVDTRPSRKGRNGNTDHLSTEDSGGKKPEDKAEGEEGLRRLGLS